MTDQGREMQVELQVAGVSFRGIGGKRKKRERKKRLLVWGGGGREIEVKQEREEKRGGLCMGVLDRERERERSTKSMYRNIIYGCGCRSGNAPKKKNGVNKRTVLHAARFMFISGNYLPKHIHTGSPFLVQMVCSVVRATTDQFGGCIVIFTSAHEYLDSYTSHLGAPAR